MEKRPISRPFLDNGLTVFDYETSDYVAAILEKYKPK